MKYKARSILPAGLRKECFEDILVDEKEHCLRDATYAEKTFEEKKRCQKNGRKK